MSITDEILKGLKTIHNHDYATEIRYFPKGGKKRTDSGLYDFAHLDKCAEDIAKIDGMKAIPAIYATLNPVQKIAMARSYNRMTQYAENTSTEEMIVSRIWLPFDIDPVRPAKTSSTDEGHVKSLEKAHEVKDWLTEHGFPAPIVADSGNGTHLLYRIDEPNTPITKELIINVQKAVIAALNQKDVDGIDIQGFADANRIFKVYGTKTQICDEIPDMGIYHRRSKMLEVPDDIQIVTTEQLQDVAALYQPDIKEQPQQDKKTFNGDKFDIEGWMRKHDIEWVRIKNESDYKGYVLKSCVFNPDHSGSGEAIIIQYTTGKLGYKCHHNSCSEKHWSDVRKIFEPVYRENKNSGDNPDKPCGECKFHRNGVNDKLQDWARCELNETWLNPFNLSSCDEWELKKEKKEPKAKEPTTANNGKGAIELLTHKYDVPEVVALIEEIEHIKKIRPLIEGDDYTYKIQLRGSVLVIPSKFMMTWRVFAQRYLEEFDDIPPSDLAKVKIWTLFLKAMKELDLIETVTQEIQDDYCYDAIAFLNELRTYRIVGSSDEYKSKKNILVKKDDHYYFPAANARRIKEKLNLKVPHKILLELISKKYKCGEQSVRVAGESTWCWELCKGVISDENVNIADKQHKEA